ncbi:photosynthetic complex assembly protein PuhC [Rhodospirillum rubrum]|uniref:Photosynthetic complex assembly protein n=2 Tax=Rhodospirillum rubrum TaxID=1085 RepID=Q2RWS6_RHORT|nr:photosynthetic complex assembly protein PuhC [Rhodospirillum rubrum]ABC21419.1 photosynthetic complex assembly protein [Rhodospirillum rubrum ATCC 11170]AEO47101.1 photosynthetic complex assembly protein [Rhodospirillum rubrum F11]MBK5953013.1 phosphonate-binding protein [Rhodospirillum rubrum]QXG81098.1 phosphonate-binding protein [Rhodospirillum rubrum]HAQ00200.1 phosphonate-binding protein [Rhodospirillum rubrum]
MSAGHRDPIFPRGLKIATLGLVLLTFGLIGFSRLTDVGHSTLPAATAEGSAWISFLPRENGDVAVVERDSAREIAILASGDNNFAVGMLRGLARQRARIGVAATDPYELTRWTDGRLTMTDPATGHIIVANAFGSKSAAQMNGFYDAAQAARDGR